MSEVVNVKVSRETTSWLTEQSSITGLSHAQLVEYLCSIGHKIVKNPEFKGLFQTRMLASLTEPKNTSRQLPDESEEFDYTVDESMFKSTKSLADCCITLAWMHSLMAKHFPSVRPFDVGTRVYKSLASRYCIRTFQNSLNSQLVSYNIASVDRQVQPVAISDIRRAISILKSSFPSYYIGHIFVNASKCPIPGKSDWAVEISKTYGYTIVWMTIESDAEQSDNAEAYIENAMRALMSMKVRPA